MVFVIGFWVWESGCMEDLKLILAVLCCCEDIMWVGICLDLIFAETRTYMIGVSLHCQFNTFMLIAIGVIAINLFVIPMTLWILRLQALKSLHMMIGISIGIIGSLYWPIFIVIHIGMLNLWFIYFYFCVCIDGLWCYFIICDRTCNLLWIYFIVFLWVFRIDV